MKCQSFTLLFKLVSCICCEMHDQSFRMAYSSTSISVWYTMHSLILPTTIKKRKKTPPLGRIFLFPVSRNHNIYIYIVQPICAWFSKHLSSDHYCASKYSTVKLSSQSCNKMYLNVTKLFIAKLQFNNVLSDYLQGFDASQWLILRKKELHWQSICLASASFSGYTILSTFGNVW